MHTSYLHAAQPHAWAPLASPSPQNAMALLSGRASRKQDEDFGYDFVQLHIISCGVWWLQFDRASSGLAGLSFEEGNFSVFGYITGVSITPSSPPVHCLHWRSPSHAQCAGLHISKPAVVLPHKAKVAIR